jgi:hypothetical protein
MITPRLLFASLWLAAAALQPAVLAVEVTETVPAADISPSASSSWIGLSPASAVNGSGLDAKGKHDHNAQSVTSWHSTTNPVASSPAPGLPSAQAWLRCDFKKPRTLDRCLIWNHNQENLSDRGFRHVQLFVSPDGKTWEAVKVDGQDVFELPRAQGADAQAYSLSVTLPRKAIQSAILLAKDNYGGNVFGISELRFICPAADIPEAQLPIPREVKVEEFPFSVKGRGEWDRGVKIQLDQPLFTAVEAAVTCGGKTRKTQIPANSQGARFLVLPLPEGAGAKRQSRDPVKVELRAGLWSKSLETAIIPPEPWPELEEVIVTWKCHLDIGYTHSVPDVIAKYRGHDMDQMLAMFDMTKDAPEAERFRWMLPAWAMETVLDKDQDPARRAKLEQAVRDNRLSWHAIPYTFESDAADLEELVRGLGYGSRLARRFGQPLPADAKQTDMPEQAWVLPTLLAKAGVKFLHIGSNAGSKPAEEFAKIPPLSWWEGPDGSRVLLGYSPQYGWDSITPPKDWKHKTWLAFFVRNDNAGPPSPREVEMLLKHARKQLPGVKIRFGRPSDFADAILAEEKLKPSLPVIRADMPDTWCHGQMSCPQPTAIHRRAAPLLASLGGLDTSMRSWGLSPDPVAPLLEDGYRNGGFYAEHTWGINGYFRGSFGEEWRKKYEAGAFKATDATYEYHMDYARKAKATAAGGLSRRLGDLAAATRAEGPRVVVFNPLPWRRDALAELAADLKPGAWLAKDLASAWSSSATVKDGTIRFLAKDLPPGGYKTFALSPDTSRDLEEPKSSLPADGVLKTEHFTASFDLEKGGIRSLIENATGRELVRPGGHALGQFLHERFSADEVNRFVSSYCPREAGGWVWSDFGKGGMPDAKESPYLAQTPKSWSSTVELDPASIRVVLRSAETLGLAKSYELSFSFPRAQACLDIAWKVDRKTPDPIPEGGWLCLPLQVEQPSFRVGRVGGSIDPAKDIGFGANRSLITVDSGITVRAGAAGAGVGVVSPDLPLWSLGKPGLWTYEPNYVPDRAELFVNLYNNMWNTNYPLWVEGSWQASLRLWPVAAGASEEQALFTPSWEQRQTALAAFAAGKAGDLPVSQSGLALSRKGVRITAFCPNPDGAGTVLRLWEQAGQDGEIEVQLPPGSKFRRAQPVDLRGERQGEPLAVRDGAFKLSLKAWEPASFVLE